MQIINLHFVDIGDYGSNADGSIFQKLYFGQRFLTQDLDILDPKPLPGFIEGEPIPHCICCR